MPANQLNVNLLEHDVFEQSPIGRIVTWATTYGRYIMITTEIIVLLAFISRFSLDRKLADLNDEIENKQAIIVANQDFEKQVRTIQSQLSRINTLVTDQEKPLTYLQLIKSIIPDDVYFTSYNYYGYTLNIDAYALTTQGFMTFMNNLQSVRQFQTVDIGEIKKNPQTGIQFKFTITFASPKPQKPATPASPANTDSKNINI